MNLYLYKYNNYYNRIVKKERYLGEYPTPLQAFSNINFNPNDGIDTEHIFNYTGDQPDYCIVSDTDNNIVSRWFVIEAARTRNGQYKVTLHRDVMADYYDSVVTSPMFIEKATLSQNDPMIFNKENISFNQIKTSETLLKDETGCAWICGYVARDSVIGVEGSGGTYNPITFQSSVAEDIILDDIIDWEYYRYAHIGPISPGPSEDRNCLAKLFTAPNTSYEGTETPANPLYDYVRHGFTKYIVHDYTTELSDVWYNNFNTNGGSIKPQIKFTGTPQEFENYLNADNDNFNAQLELYGDNYITDLDQYNTQDYQNMLLLNNKIIHATSTDKYYRVRVDALYQEREYPVNSGNLYNYFINYLTQNNKVTITRQPYEDDDYMHYNALYLTVQTAEAALILEEINLAQFSIPVTDPDDRLHLRDAPYDMFCIPYGDVIVKQSQHLVTLNKDNTIAVAQGIAEALGNKLYDIQLLPYAPLTGLTIEGNEITIDSSKSERVTWIQNNIAGLGTDACPMIWAAASSGTKYLTNDEYKITITDKKISNECDLYRLCSPNYNGQFEFSAAKNNGVSRFRVDYTYLPYNPYIHVAPDFKNLYGNDFADARGLICRGDFSIGYLSDAWVNYQNNNKNYQNIFDRQIQNMEVNQKYQRMSEIINASVGSLSGGLSGATAGSMIGGGWGAAIGGGVGLAASAAGGIADIAINDKLRNEALDYTKDQFGYQLGNIQALPDSIAKTTAYTENNKIFPVLEYYTCTDVEKQALKDKLKYNGMTVMRIGNIQEFQQALPSYIKGKLIRNESISEDYHLLNAIAGELDKGVFI